MKKQKPDKYIVTTQLSCIHDITELCFSMSQVNISLIFVQKSKTRSKTTKAKTSITANYLTIANTS